MLFEEEDAELRGWWTVSVALGAPSTGVLHFPQNSLFGGTAVAHNGQSLTVCSSDYTPPKMLRAVRQQPGEANRFGETAPSRSRLCNNHNDLVGLTEPRPSGSGFFCHKSPN